MAKELKPAVAYLRTSSAANVGADKDSDKRQRAAIEAYAKRSGFTIIDQYYDKAVSGAYPLADFDGGDFTALRSLIGLVHANARLLGGLANSRG